MEDHALADGWATLFAQAAGRSNGLRSTIEVADELGVGGLVRRFSGDPSPVEADGDVVFARAWSGTVLDAGADLVRLLTPAGITPLAFKGGALLGREYRPGDITPTDLDVLIPEHAAASVAEVLVEVGWLRRAPTGGPEMSGGPGVAFERPFGGDAMGAIEVDTHWRLAPVHRVFPWRGLPIPDEVWEAADLSGPLPRPRPGHHAALLVHHFVRHDGLHFRSLFDLSWIWESLAANEEAEAFRLLARRLRVERAASELGEALVQGLGLPELRGSRHRDRPRGRTLGNWIDLALVSGEREFEAMTLSRGLRRLTTIDRPVSGAVSLLAETLLPPAEYLSWRWPDSSMAAARAKHLLRLIGHTKGRDTNV